MTPDRAGRATRDRLIAAGVTDTAEIRARGDAVAKYVEENSQARLNVYNRVLGATGDKAKEAADLATKALPMASIIEPDSGLNTASPDYGEVLGRAGHTVTYTFVHFLPLRMCAVPDHAGFTTHASPDVR